MVSQGVSQDCSQGGNKWYDFTVEKCINFKRRRIFKFIKLEYSYIIASRLCQNGDNNKQDFSIHRLKNYGPNLFK